MIRIRRMDHVGLRVDDSAESEAFYSGLLGLAAAPMPAPGPDHRERMDLLKARVGAPAPTGGKWLQAGETQLHMIEARGAAGRNAGGSANPFGAHVAFEVEDFEAARAELDARGVPYVDSPLSNGFRQLWLLDPSGNTVELFTKL